MSGFILTSPDQSAAADGSMFENGVQDVAEVCGYQSNDASHIEVYCIEPSSNGPENASYTMKHGSSVVEHDVIENCLADAAAALVKNAYCMESTSGGEHSQDSFQFVTEPQYQLSAGADNTDGLYRLEAGQAYQIESSHVDMNQESHEVTTDSGTGSLVLQCVEYVGDGSAKCDGDDQMMAGVFQTATVAAPMIEGSYEIVMLPNGSRALRKIKPACKQQSKPEGTSSSGSR